MRKLAGVSVVIALAVAILAIWVNPAALTGQAEALTEPIIGISIDELQLRVDVKSLPVQEIADPI
jgi:hypothetical protein